MTDTPNDHGNLADEMRSLGKSIGNFFHSAWESEQRKEVQEEILSALNEVTASLNQTVEDFKGSETHRQIKQDVEDLEERIKSGELEQKARQEMQNILQHIRAELDRASEMWGQSDSNKEE